MAQIIEETITIKISRMVADGDTTTSSVVTQEVKEQLGLVAAELIGDGAIVEVFEGA